MPYAAALKLDLSRVLVRQDTACLVFVKREVPSDWDLL